MFAKNQGLPVQIQTKAKQQPTKYNESILPNLLRVKRSISYETVLFANELREKLKVIMKGADYPSERCALASILEGNNNTLN